MQQNTGGDIRRRFGPSPSLGQIGDILGLSPTTYLNSGPPSLWPSSDEASGQLGKNIILAAEGPRPTGNAAQTPHADGDATAIAHPTQRSLFDIAGRFHDFQASPKIARPNLAQEFIPVVGPAWDAAADLQDGRYGSAAFNAAMAVGDLLPVGYGVKAGKGAWKLGRAMGTFLPKAAAIQRKMHKIGLALPTEEVHHVLALNGLGRYVPSFKNSPLFLKVLPKEVHRRLHGRWGGQPKFGLLPQLWHGTTDWMKSAAAEATRDAGYAGQDFEQWLWGKPQPAQKK